MNKKLYILNVVEKHEPISVGMLPSLCKIKDERRLAELIDELGLEHYISGDPQTGKISLYTSSSIRRYKRDLLKKRFQICTAVFTGLCALLAAVPAILQLIQLLL